MNSLEALKILKDSYHTKRDTELLSIIENDLEVLKILQKILKVKKSDLFGFTIVVRGDDEQENLIKEWLENDK